MIPVQSTCAMDELLAALRSDDHAAIRKASNAVLCSAFDHLFFDVEKPMSGDGFAMCSLIVAAGE